MVLSMTGFGKAAASDNSFKVTVEIKSLNSRNADIKIKAPGEFRNKEFEIRTQITDGLQRGKIDLSIEVEKLTGSEEVRINEERFYQNFETLKLMAEKTGSNSSDVFSLALKMPDVIESRNEELNPSLWGLTNKVIAEAIVKLNEFRASEGNNLEEDMLNRVAEIENSLAQIELLAPERAKTVEERLQQKIEEITEFSDNDKSRLHQEVIYYLEKYDINEEVVRLKSHCNYFKETLKAGNGQGKKLGFIGQEMGREINTIGSKANHAEIQRLVVQMKDELEKVKEQSLNVL
jgi:uncharacterized protein (TIGR00255 family)